VNLFCKGLNPLNSSTLALSFITEPWRGHIWGTANVCPIRRAWWDGTRLKLASLSSSDSWRFPQTVCGDSHTGCVALLSLCWDYSNCGSGVLSWWVK
jgi:hypothetical protein